MHIGVSLPVRELGDDIVAIRDFAQAADELGFTHLRIPDLILRKGGGALHEPMTLLAFVAAVTRRIRLVRVVYTAGVCRRASRHSCCRVETGRQVTDIGSEAGVAVVGPREAEWRDRVLGWREAGLTHLCIRTLGGGLQPEEHLPKLRSTADELLQLPLPTPVLQS